jgi:hypothetical protein
MATHDFTDPDVRDEYFRPSQGRPSDDLIIKAIGECVKAIIEHGFSDGDAFTSDQLCLSIWEEFASQHQYIGLRIRWLIRRNKLAIRKVGVRSDKRVLYMIILDA